MKHYDVNESIICFSNFGMLTNRCSDYFEKHDREAQLLVRLDREAHFLVRQDRDAQLLVRQDRGAHQGTAASIILDNFFQLIANILHTCSSKEQNTLHVVI